MVSAQEFTACMSSRLPSLVICHPTVWPRVFVRPRRGYHLCPVFFVAFATRGDSYFRESSGPRFREGMP